MNLFPAHIRLFGKMVLVDELIKKTDKPGNEKELAGFLKEWYNSNGFIKVKSSGSTGKPKTIRLMKEFVAQSAARTTQYFRLTEGDRILHCLPLNFIAGKLMVVRALLKNLDLYWVDPSTGFSFLQQEKFRFAAMVPHQVKKILAREPSPGAWLRNIDQLLIGGSALPQLLETQLQNIPTACYSSYGMTETATHIALRRINGNDPEEWYHCLTDVRVGLSKKGCLQIYMPGLKNEPLQTTDLAEMKNEKTFRILGRSDNAIISGGIKFFPEQLEKKLESFIREPFLISSLPHDSLGKQLVLVVEGKKSAEFTNRLQEICRCHLDTFEQPRQIAFVSEIPKTKNGKLKRKIKS